MTLGELLANLLQGAGQGAQHQYATETRGGDYLLKEEQAGRAGEAAALTQGTTLRDAMTRRAMVTAAANQARQGSGVPPGADDELAAASGAVQQDTQKRDLERQAAEAGIRLQGAQADELGRRPSSADLEAERQRGRTELEAERQRGRIALEGERANRPPAPLSPAGEAGIVDKLGQRWTKATEPLAVMNRQRQLMQTGLDAARRGDLAQGAQAVLVTFQKILDPPSVVRESEYNRSGAGLAMMDRVRGAYERLVQGGAGVPLTELEKFAQLADEAIKAQSGGYIQAVKGRLGKVADHYGIPHDLVFEDFDFGGGGGAGPAATAAPAAGASKRIRVDEQGNPIG